MAQLGRALDRLFGQLAGAHDFAKAPHRQREMRSCQDPSIKSKTESRQRIAMRRIIGEGLFKEGLPLPEIALKKTGRAEATAGGARFRGAPPVLRLPQEGLGRPSRLGPFGPHVTPDKMRIVRRESLRVVPPAAHFAEASESLLGLLRGETLRPHERLAEGSLDLDPALAPGGCGPDLFSLGQRLKQGFRFGDLRHFRRRRKAIESGREDGVGFGRAAGGLVELGERERCAQLEAARALTLSDGDGGLERLLGARRLGWVTLQQHFPADAMQFGFERAMADPFARRQRFVETRDGALGIACSGFGFGKGNLDESVEEQDVLLAHKFDPATHGLEPTAGCATLRSGQTLEKDGERSPEGQIMLARELGKFDAVHYGTRRIVTHQSEHDCEGSVVGVRADVREARHPRLSVANEGNGATDVAQRHKVSARYSIAATPSSCPKRKARSSSRPGWKSASAWSKVSRASTYSPANL